MQGPITRVDAVGAGAHASLEQELKELMVEALMLEDVSPDDIDSEAPLFDGGLGLDSIDVLELAMALNKRYGVKTRADDERNEQIFASVRSLAAFVADAGKGTGE
jgi:acyl carrier protein